MKFKFKSREDRLKNRINALILNKMVDAEKLNEVIQAINDYEKDNLDTITKLKKVKQLETKRISGALRQTINAHGPITLNYIGSATKRIYGVLLNNPNKEKEISIDLGTFILIQIAILIVTFASILIFI